MQADEYDEIFCMEQYIVRRGWERAPEVGRGRWQKFDPWGSLIGLSLDQAYRYELERDSVQ